MPTRKGDQKREVSGNVLTLRVTLGSCLELLAAASATTTQSKPVDDDDKVAHAPVTGGVAVLDPDDESSGSGGDDDDSEDETAELMRELARIKKEREAEQARLVIGFALSVW
jgi:hypothetical protein